MKYKSVARDIQIEWPNEIDPVEIRKEKKYMRINIEYLNLNVNKKFNFRNLSNIIVSDL